MRSGRVWLWLSARERLLFGALILLHLVPIWAFQYFPSGDGPTHLDNANIIREYNLPALTTLREYYTINTGISAFWLGHVALASLMSLVPMLVAEKIFLSGYVILLPLSIRYAIRSINVENEAVAFLSLPLIYTYTFHMGFYNFSYSLVMFFFCIGYWIKHRERFGLRHGLTLALISTLLYFFHIVSWVLAFVTVSVLALSGAMLEKPNRTKERRLRRVKEVLLSLNVLSLLFFVPTVVLACLFVQDSGWNARYDLSAWNPKMIVWHLLSYQRAEMLVYLPFTLGFAFLLTFLLTSKIVRRDFRRWDVLLVVFISFVVIYALAPRSAAGGGVIPPRLALYLFFALILWFGAQRFSMGLSRVVIGTSVVLSLTLLGINSMQYADINRYLREYVSASKFIEPNATLLPVSFSNRERVPGGHFLKVGPFMHAASYIAAERNAVLLTNYEGYSTGFPIKFRPQLNPFVHLRNLENLTSADEVLSYADRTGGRIDYVLVWGIKDNQIQNDDLARPFFKRLNTAYSRIFVSSENGLMHLYRRKT
ncbi:MAG TPA: hypothetical protein VGW77_18725 [Candidatus Binatia bacterium]|jgi:hypothetical protein|nr:hypothetical protein [Candidatus Binatia bacterium]